MSRRPGVHLWNLSSSTSGLVTTRHCLLARSVDFPPLARRRVMSSSSRSPSLAPTDKASLQAAAAAMTADKSPPTTTADDDPTSLSHAELVARVSALERQLREQNARLAELTATTEEGRTSAQRPSTASSSKVTWSPSRPRADSSSRRARPFDPTLYATRHIALKFAYLGGRYNGFEHANGNVVPKPTVEEVLWKALRKARLISPPVADDGTADDSVDVVWPEHARLARYTGGEAINGKVRLDISWEGCQYSKCGRTDRGVSAFGQVVGIRVRSNRPIRPTPSRSLQGSLDEERNGLEERVMPDVIGDVGSEPEDYEATFDPVKDELSYVSILNGILPPDIRVLAWCPDPPPTFDARFSCRERRYKYFFTNPAFCPTPGPHGMQLADGRPTPTREGWLDVDKMREAARKLQGLHDFRNLCRIDASKQMPNCERRITYADVVEMEEPGRMFAEHPGLNQHGQPGMAGTAIQTVLTPPKVYAFCVHGTAFLWHQVRCMAAILFLVGQGLEEPELVDALLDIERTPGRPTYEMADDAPLVLWDCIFPDDPQKMEDSLHWLYAGDEATLPGLTARNDGKFGTGAVVDGLWSQWREAKISEVLAGSLLDLAIGQGDGSSLRRHPARAPKSQKVFDGGNQAKMAGRYLPVMQKSRVDTLEAQNAKYANSRKGRQRNDARIFRDTNGGGTE